MSLRVNRLFTVFLCTLLFVLPLSAQTITGTVRGQVTDSSGAALPGVTVTIRNMDTGSERVVITNDDGNYNAPFLPPGKYEVTANLEGMGAQTRQGIQLPVNQTVDQNFTLGMQMAETVTVVAEQPRVNTVNAEIKKSMNALEVIDKPSIQGEGRTAFLSLAETFAG